MRGWMTWAWITGVLPGCDDHLFAGEPPADGVTGEGWCAVQSMFASSCLGCHSAAGQAGGLDLETHPWESVVGAPSASGGVLVSVGDTEGSVLLAKLRGTPPATARRCCKPLTTSTVWSPSRCRRE